MNNLIQIPAVLAMVLAFWAMPAAAAEKPREWLGADGVSTITGTLLAYADGLVTMKRADDRVFTFPVDKLSPADRAYVERFSGAKTAPKKEDGMALAAALGGIRLGATQQEVVAALARNPRFSSTLPEALRGRTGLNGVYRARSASGEYGLYLDFDEAGALVAASLQGETTLAEKDLKSAWEDLRAEFGEAELPARLQADYPATEVIREEAAIITDVYEYGERFITMGIARNERGMILVFGLAAHCPARVAGQ